jgi:Na+-driven multidrug efflux pump
MPIKPQLHSHYTDVTEDQYIEEATSEYADPDCVHCQAGEPLYVAKPESLKPNSPPRNELSILLTSSFPLVCSYTLQTSLVAITLLFVGRLGKEELAGVSLACLTANVTGWSVFQGLASALDTLCPQAYGTGLKRAVGLHTQRMSLLLLFISIPIGLFWYVKFSEPASPL